MQPQSWINLSTSNLHISYSILVMLIDYKNEYVGVQVV